MRMLNMLLGTVLGAVITLATVGMAQDGLGEKIATMDKPVIKPIVYLVETGYGWNIRVYDWKSPFSQNMRCAMAVGQQEAGGMSCYYKP